MRDHTFDELKQVLQSSGIEQRYIRRMLTELHDHFDDLQREAVRQGCHPFEAYELALTRIGDQRVLAHKFLEVPELRPWHHRHPRLALIYYPVAYVILLPAAPVVARWVAALSLGATITAAMMLAMQLSISLG